MDYGRLLSDRFPPENPMPAGLAAKTKYVFSVTFADPETLPPLDMGDALMEALVREGRDLAMYPAPQGHPAMREFAAEHVKRRGIDVGPESVVLTGGAGGAIQVIIDAFIDPGDVVLVEEFSYLGTLNMLLAKRAEVVHVRTDAGGMDTDALEAELKRLARAGKRPKLIYTISVYQNPLGVTLGLERRKRMLSLSQEYGVPILENESYADFRIDGPPLPPAIMSMDTSGQVMYVSAFTKLLGCALRLGFAVVPPEVVKILGRLRYGGAPSQLSALAVNGYMRREGYEHIRQVAGSLRAKRDALFAALEESFPPYCESTRPHGGMMVWVRLPEGADTWKALDAAVAAGVKYNPGAVFRAKRDRGNYLRLTYSYNTPAEIREGVAILADVFRREGLFDERRDTRRIA